MDRERSRTAGKSFDRERGTALLIGRAKDRLHGALRRIALSGQAVDYRLFRARRRSIGMIIDHEGLVVRAPSWVPMRDIELALTERAEWVVKTLLEWRGRDREAFPAEWREGAALLYRGRPLTLALFPARKKKIAADLLHLTVLHPDPQDEPQIAAFVRGWLQEQALALLLPRVAHFASRVNSAAPAVKLSSARTQWGSCNHKGEIRLHWRLIQLPPRIADYVIAHEVAHLIELNHSARFWALVESLLPGHAAARRELDALTPLLG